MPIKCRYGQNYQISLQHLLLFLRNKLTERLTPFQLSHSHYKQA